MSRKWFKPKLMHPFPCNSSGCTQCSNIFEVTFKKLVERELEQKRAALDEASLALHTEGSQEALSVVEDLNWGRVRVTDHRSGGN